MKLILLVEEYLDFCRYTKKLSHHTIRAYRGDLNEWMRFAKPSRRISECGRDLIKDYVRYLFEKCNLKESSVKRRIACLKAMFRWLEVEDRIDENPFHRVFLKIRLPSTLPRSLSQNEIRRLMFAPVKKLGFSNRAECRGNELAEAVIDRKSFTHLTTLIAIELLFVTGIRVGELVSLKILDMDLQEGSIRIHGKGDRERVVFLPYPETRELIRAYLKLRVKRLPTGDSLLIIPLGRPADSQHIRKLICKAGENAGLNRRITPHMLRHTTATELLNNGVDIRFVQKLLGHQSITTTQIYTQVTDVALRKAITRGHPMKRLVNS